MDMDNQQSQAPQVSEEISQAVETQAVETQAEGEGSKKSLESQPTGLPNEPVAAKGEGDLNGQAQAAAFVPNLEYEVRGQKKQFDERLKDLIKSKEHEDLIRDLHTKADGIDTIKEQREYIRNQFSGLQKEVNQVLDMTERGDLKGALQSVGWDTSDIGKTLQGLGYDKRSIIEYAYSLANLTPEQEQYQNQLRQAELEKRELAKQTQTFQSQLEQIQVQSRRTELQNILSKPDIQPIVEAFDKEYGSNAFFQEVANRGALYWHQSKKDVPPEQLVQEVLRFARHLPQQQTPTQTPPKRKEDLPVIPAVGGGGSQAPVSKRITSIEEMKRYAQTLRD